MPTCKNISKEEPQGRPSSTIRINETPTCEPPTASPQADQGYPPPQLQEEERPHLPPWPILRNSESNQPPQLEAVQNNYTNDQEDGFIHDKVNKLLKEVKNGHKVHSFYVKDFAGLFPVWPIIELAMAPTGQTKDERMTQFVKCVTTFLERY
jgi:hypothetical protein